MVDLTKFSGLNLEKYDYKIVIDRSGSMGLSNDGQTRWQQAHDISKAIAEVCDNYDDDGIDIILFDSEVKEFNNVKAVKVDDIFRKHGPRGSTDTAAALRLALANYYPQKTGGGFLRKAKVVPVDLSNKKPLIVIVLTDGAPNSQGAVKTAIIDATKVLSDRKQLGITFLQVGNDSSASRFLTYLDDHLENDGAKFDIVDTKQYDEVKRMSPEDILIGALTD